MSKKLHPRFFLAAIVFLAAAGCTAHIDHHGKLPDPEQMAKIKPGVQDKEEVLRLIGSPSSIAVFDENTWIYNYKVTESVSFLTPREIAQKLYLIHFDAQGKVQEVREEDGHGHDIVPVRRATPNPGDDRTFLQSIFGSFGKKAKKITDEDKQKDD